MGVPGMGEEAEAEEEAPPPEVPAEEPRGDEEEEAAAGGPRQPRLLGEAAVAASFLVHVGGISFLAYCFAPLLLPICETFGVGRGRAAWTGAFAAGTGPLGGVVAKSLQRVVPLAGKEARITCTMALATVACFVSFLAAAVAETLVVLYLTLGVGAGLSCGMLYFDTISQPSQLFRSDRRGLATGIATSGAGMGGFIWPFITVAMITQYGWTVCFVALGFTFLGLHLLALACSVYTRTSMASLRRSGSLKDVQEIGLWNLFVQWDIQIVLWSRVCYQVAIMVAFVHLDAFAEDLGHGPGFGATLVALLGVGSTTGRVLGGLLSDRLGTFPVFLSMTSGTGVLFAVWPACRSKVAMAVLSLLIGLTFGAYTSLSPLVCSEIWGDAVVSEVVSVVYLGDAPSRLTGGPIAGFVFDWSGSYVAAILGGAFLIFFSVALVGFVIHRRARRRAAAAKYAALEQDDEQWAAPGAIELQAS